MIKAMYNVFADDFHQSRQRPWPEFDICKALTSKNDTVLDLGCGNGRLRKIITPDNITHGEYFGIDISNKLLQYAQKSFPKDCFKEMDFSQKLSFKNKQFDKIFSIAAFHHLLSKKEQEKCLNECHRILKKNGKILITTWKIPRKFLWKSFLRFQFKNILVPFGQNKKPRIYRRVNNIELSKLMQKSGFKIEESTLFQNRNYIVIGEKI